MAIISVIFFFRSWWPFLHFGINFWKLGSEFKRGLWPSIFDWKRWFFSGREEFFLCSSPLKMKGKITFLSFNGNSKISFASPKSQASQFMAFKTFWKKYKPWFREFLFLVQWKRKTVPFQLHLTIIHLRLHESNVNLCLCFYLKNLCKCYFEAI